MNCEHSTQLHAYHDGQLDGQATQRMEQHLRECAACRQELACLRRMSQWLGGMHVPALSAEALVRMHQRVEQARESSLLHIAEFLTAAAAAVLLVGLIGLAVNQQAAAQPSAWEQTAVTLQVDSQTTSPEVQLAGWMDRELSRRGVIEP